MGFQGARKNSSLEMSGNSSLQTNSFFKIISGICCVRIISACISFRDAQKKWFSSFKMIVMFVFLQFYFSRMSSSRVYVRTFFTYIGFEYAQKNFSTHIRNDFKLFFQTTWLFRIRYSIFCVRRMTPHISLVWAGGLSFDVHS